MPGQQLIRPQARDCGQSGQRTVLHGVRLNSTILLQFAPASGWAGLQNFFPLTAAATSAEQIRRWPSRTALGARCR